MVSLSLILSVSLCLPIQGKSLHTLGEELESWVKFPAVGDSGHVVLEISKEQIKIQLQIELIFSFEF